MHIISLKSFIFVITAVIGIASSSAAISQDKETENHVGIAVAASRDTLGPGAGAEILFTFSPKKGYHVNAVPPMAVKFDSTSQARAGGKIVIPADSATGYLRTSVPVRQPFTLAKSAGRGRTELKGVLTYYYCSDAGGWCRKENLPFTVPVKVK